MRFLLIALLATTALSGCLAEAPPAEADVEPVDDPLPVLYEDLTFHDTVATTAGADPVVGCGAMGDLDRAATTWNITAPAGSQEAYVQDMSLTFTWAPTSVEADYAVYGPDGEEVARSTAFQPGVSSENLRVEGYHRVGDFTIVVLACAGGGEVTIDGTAALAHVPAAPPAPSASETL